MNSRAGQNSTRSSSYNGTNNYQKELFYLREGTTVVCSEIPVSKNLYYIERNQSIDFLCQLTGFYDTRFYFPNRL